MKHSPWWSRGVGCVWSVSLLWAAWMPEAVGGDGWQPNPEAERWRTGRRVIDLHQHVAYTEDALARNVRLMDRVGIGWVVNLSGGTVTRPQDGGPSEFERNQTLADRLHPGRFVHYVYLDYAGWDEPDFSARAVAQIEEAHRLGAAGLKEFKRLGLYLKDGKGRLIRVDDPKLDPVWRRCGELGLPVSIHVADPQAFWRPYDATNERWKELKDHPNWWFGDRTKYPEFPALLDALDRVIARHPETTFVCVHFANNAEDLAWVEAALDRRPNMWADLAARVPEIGRHPPEAVKRLFLKHADRILFATDFQVYEGLTLGSGGSGPAPGDDEAVEFFRKHWRWLETQDRQFEHMTPIQGDWRIDAIGLPTPVLRKVYFDNARRLLVRSLPTPTVRVPFAEARVRMDGRLKEPGWQKAAVVEIDGLLRDGTIRPEWSTRVRLFWSPTHLHLGYEAPFEKLTVFEPRLKTGERPGLWDRDVVEVFIGTDAANPGRYSEYEVAPTGEKLDLWLDRPRSDLSWESGFEAAVRVDSRRKLWVTEMRIPLPALSADAPRPGTRWRMNLYRHDVAHGAFLAWHPTASGTAHVPARFGVLEFGE